jgi:hypothetical protein
MIDSGESALPVPLDADPKVQCLGSGEVEALILHILGLRVRIS